MQRGRDAWTRPWGLLVVGLVACAPQRAALRDTRECQGDREVAVLCGGGLCAVVPQGPGAGFERTLTEGALAIEPPLAEAPERLGGSGDWEPSAHREPIIVFEFNPQPPEAKYPPHIRALLAEEAKKPHVKHHIFPQEFKDFFTDKEINIHAWVMVLLLEEHLRIHRGPSGGPWNADWRVWIKAHRETATQEDIYRYAGEMIYRYCLTGTLTRYYCDRSRPAPPAPTDPVAPVNEDD